MITSEIFVAYAQCQLKSYSLLCTNKEPIPNEYISILNERAHKTRLSYFNKINQKFPNVRPYFSHEMQKGTTPLIDINLEVEDLSAYVDVLTKSENTIPYNIYIPTIIIGAHKIHKEHRLQLAFVSYVLSKIQKQKPNFGNIVGGNKKIHRIKTEFLYKDVEQFLRKLRKWKSGQVEPPPVILNRHCPYCIFQQECELEAKKKDHLSLLRGMSEKEIITQNKRGIFTVTQFSYTYRPRKNRKGHQNRKYYHSLKALSIRNKKIYIVELPAIPKSKTQIFFDVEGIPDQDFYYLIGVVVIEGFSTKQYSFGADDKKDELKIYKEFLEILKNYNDFTLFHYGSFDSQFLIKMNKKYDDNESAVERLKHIQANSINVLSMIYGKIYFPTCSNSLKDIAKYLGWKWSEANATGLKSLVWRHQWDNSHEPYLNKKLVQYNSDDCHALKNLVETITKISRNDFSFGEEIVPIDEIPNESTYKFGRNQYQFQELEFVNSCAYFDYQREKVFFRDQNKKSSKAKAKKKIACKYHVNKKIEIPIPSNCNRCNSSELYRHGRKYKTVWDIKFFNFGVKRCVLKYSTSRVRCRSCGSAFPPSEFHEIKSKYGYNLYIWIVYQIIVLRQTYNRIQQNLWEIFRYRFGSQICQKSKYIIADYYFSTYQQILNKLKNGKLIHADETSVNIRGKNSYVWVVTSLEEVLYIYSPTREGNTLNEILQGFSGVLVSDFYTAYDSFECAQQKCLIHLIRDINAVVSG